MSKNLKNLVIILVVALMALAGYYIYTQRGVNELSFETSATINQDVIANAQVFIMRRATLERIRLDVSMFEDPVFLSLRDYTDGVEPIPTGRENPFEERETLQANSEN